MPFPRRLLADHEELILDIRPHWIALAWPVSQALVIALGAAVAISYVPVRWPSWVRWAAFIVAVSLFVAYPVRHLLDWVTSHFVVTSDRLIHRSGWFAKRSMEMPLERINDVRLNQSVFERLIGAGDLTIESAGEYGQNRFTDIRDPEAVQKLIYEVGERNQQRMLTPQWREEGTRLTDRFDAEFRTTEDLTTSPEREPTLVEQLERLADLRDRGVIAEAEFREERDRLLRGGSGS